MSDPCYLEVLSYLSSLNLLGIQPGTERMAEVLARLGQPQQRFLAIHIAGTNGKGSTAAYCATLLAHAARQAHRDGQPLRKIALYTSPHLLRVRERMQLSAADGELHECSESELAQAVHAVTAASKQAPAVQLTFFEVLTAAAFWLFAQAEVHLAVIETGLGGRLDATRLCRAVATIVTSIGLDHVELLGPTLPAIAREKAGIFVPQVPTYLACQDPAARQVLLSEAQRLGAPCSVLARQVPQSPTPNLNAIAPLDAEQAAAVALPGQHQLDNAALALAAVKSLPTPLQPYLQDRALQLAALAAVKWPGRLEQLFPCPTASRFPAAQPPAELLCLLPEGLQLWLDAAHNPEGAEVLATWLQSQRDTSSPPRPLTILFGAVAGKQLAGMTGPLLHADQLVLTCPPSPRGLSAHQLAQTLPPLLHQPPQQIAEDWQQALRLALRHTPPNGMLVVYGSIFLVAAVRGLWRQEATDPLVVQDPGKKPAP